MFQELDVKSRVQLSIAFRAHCANSGERPNQVAEQAGSPVSYRMK